MGIRLRGESMKKLVALLMIMLCLSASVHPMETFGKYSAFSEESDQRSDNVTVLQHIVFDTFLSQSEVLPTEEGQISIEEDPEQEGQTKSEESSAKVDIRYILLVMIGFMLIGAFMLHARDKRKEM